MVYLIKPVFTENSSESQKSDIDKFLDFANTIFRALHVLEYATLIYSYRQFTKMKSQSTDRPDSKVSDWFCRCTDSTPLKLLAFSIYIAVIIVTPSLYTAWHECLHQPVQHAYMVSLFGAFLSNFVIRAVMIVITLQVRATWLSACDTLRINSEDNGTQVQSSEDHHQLNFNNLVADYDKTGDSVSLLHCVFQRWFVIQWIIYFLEITNDCYYIYDLLTTDVGDMSDECKMGRNRSLTLHFMHLVYRVLAFGIPYSCGLSMNKHHQMYREELLKQQECILSKDSNEGVRIMQKANLIPENPKYQFIPSLCGLNISLDSTGHTLTILLSLLAFTLSLVSKLVT